MNSHAVTVDARSLERINPIARRSHNETLPSNFTKTNSRNIRDPHHYTKVARIGSTEQRLFGNSSLET